MACEGSCRQLQQRPSRPLLLLALALLLVAAQQAAAQMGGMPPGMMGGGEPPKAKAVKADVPFIRCQVCEAVVKQAYRHVKAKRAALKPGQKLHESEIIDYLEGMCDPHKPDGAWISHYDMVEKGSEIKLQDTGKPSRCNSECATIARACAQLTDELDLSDLSEALFSGQQRSKLTSEACYDSTSACRDKAPPVPKDRKRGPQHEPMSAEELQREQLMAQMKAAGLGGQMFSREDLMQQMGDLQAEADAGGIPKTRLSAAGGADGDSVVAKAQEAVQEVVGQAKEAAAAVVDKAAGLLGKLSSSLTGSSGGGGEL